jgi:hypothetical protein
MKREIDAELRKQAVKCIFCENELTDDTKPEHVLLATLGGRKTTRRVICSAHNETFGETIDKEVGRQVTVLRNLLQLDSGTGKPPPMLRGIQAGAEKVNFGSDGRPELVAKPFTVTPREDGNLDVQIHANDPDQLPKIVSHLARYLRMPENKVKKMIAAGQATLIDQRPDTAHHSLSFGGDIALRSFAKSCLVLWALRVGNHELKSAPYNDTRRFVLEGDKAFNKARIHLDSRHLPCADALQRRFGKFFNLSYVASDSRGRVIGHFTLYNLISWHMVLAESGGTPNASTAIVSNPLDPSKWSDKVAKDLPIDFAWLDSPDYTDNLRRSHERFTRAVQHHVEAARAKERDRISKEVFKKYGIEGDDELITDPEMVQKITGEIMYRFALHALGLPYEQDLTADQIAGYLNLKRDDPTSSS